MPAEGCGPPRARLLAPSPGASPAAPGSTGGAPKPYLPSRPALPFNGAEKALPFNGAENPRRLSAGERSCSDSDVCSPFCTPFPRSPRSGASTPEFHPAPCDPGPCVAAPRAPRAPGAPADPACAPGEVARSSSSGPSSHIPPPLPAPGDEMMARTGLLFSCSTSRSEPDLPVERSSAAQSRPGRCDEGDESARSSGSSADAGTGAPYSPAAELSSTAAASCAVSRPRAASCWPEPCCPGARGARRPLDARRSRPAALGTACHRTVSFPPRGSRALESLGLRCPGDLACSESRDSRVALAAAPWLSAPGSSSSSTSSSDDGPFAAAECRRTRSAALMPRTPAAPAVCSDHRSSGPTVS